MRKNLAVGTRADVERDQRGATTRMVDLGGKTLLPGFIDAHGHLKNVGFQALSANLLPPQMAMSTRSRSLPLR
jgi:predicted amidohydrolase YtcJ